MSNILQEFEDLLRDCGCAHPKSGPSLLKIDTVDVVPADLTHLQRELERLTGETPDA